MIHAVEVSWQGRSLIENLYRFTRKREADSCLCEAIATGLPGGQDTWIAGVGMQKKLGGTVVVGSTQIGLACAQRVFMSQAVLSNLLHPLCCPGPLRIPALEISLFDPCGSDQALANVCPIVDRVANGPQQFKREGLILKNKLHVSHS